MDKREPTLDELLNEPIIREMMAADGYSAEDIRLLNVSERCGCSPKAVQMRRIVVCEKPVAPAIERIDQWVASAGVERRVRSITAAT